MSARLQPIVIPDGLPAAIGGVLAAMKQNIEVLAGLTGDTESRAITHGAAKVADIDPQQSVYSVAAPTKAEFDKAVDDITRIRDRCNYLIALLRGETVGG